MQGRQGQQVELLSTINLESFIPKKHLLRRINEVIDLGFVREMTEALYCKGNGRPSIDPELFFRMLLIEYFYNISSDRQLCEEIEYNLAFRWFCRLRLEDRIPDHSSMTRIRDRLGEVTFKKVFTRIVRACEEKGLVRGKQVMMDGSLIKANAALNSLVEREPKPVEAGKAEESEDPPAHRKSIKGKRFGNETHVSSSDPDAQLAGKVGEPKALRYKAHNTMERESRVILDTHITDGAKLEGKVFFERMEAIESEYGFEIEELTADRGYGYGENLTELEKRGVRAFVPNFHSKVGDTYDPAKFKYDRENDRFECPQGHHLTVTYPPSMLKHQIIEYRMSGKICSICPLRNECMAAVADKSRGKKIRMNIHHEIQAARRAEEKTPEFRSVMNERMWKLEGLFSEGKNLHGLDRARYRGRPKMQIQAYMVGAVQNLKRLMEAVLTALLRKFRSRVRLFPETGFKFSFLTISLWRPT